MKQEAHNSLDELKTAISYSFVNKKLEDAFDVCCIAFKRGYNDHFLRLCFAQLKYARPIDRFNPIVKDAILKTISGDDVDVAKLSNLWTKILYLDSAYDLLKPYCNIDYVYDQKDWDAIQDIIDDDYFLKGISRLVIMEKNLGFALQNIRKTLLLKLLPEGKLKTRHLKFLCALATNCFNNEYIYIVTDAEKQAITNIALDNPFSISVYACYDSIQNKSFDKKISANAYFKELVQIQKEEPTEEDSIKKDIISLGSIKDKISQDVRGMYEENPYPRWRYVDVPVSIAHEAKGRILIAGCGTGRYAAEIFTRLPNVEKTAIDISLSSLAYAKRMIKKYKVINTNFYQCDILDVPEYISGQFDMINCSGVLHHMGNPMQGWKCLLEKLAPGGMMTIGLYSTLARKNVWEARDIIAKSGYLADPDGIRQFRNDYFRGKLPGHFVQFENFRDFYSLSEVRDLFFHIQETTYNLQEIEKMLDELGLDFLEMKAPESVVNNFKASFPNPEDFHDIQKWHIYEQNNPETFTGMYNFSCKRKGETLNSNVDSYIKADVFK